jgi:hypothetical protein
MSALLQNPLESLSISTAFTGAGVYLVYYSGEFEPYRLVSGTDIPIYVGKAIPRGSRRGSAALQQIEHTKDSFNAPRICETVRNC